MNIVENVKKSQYCVGSANVCVDNYSGPVSITIVCGCILDASISSLIGDFIIFLSCVK